MSDKTAYSQQRTLEYLLGISPSATVYLGLNTVAGTDSSAGTECADTNYARQAIAWSAVSGSPKSTTNSGTVTFPAAAAGYTVVQEVVWDAPSGGNRLYYKSVTSQAVAVGNSYSRPAGTFTVQEN